MKALFQSFNNYITRFFRQRKQRQVDLAQKRQYINQIIEDVIEDIDPRLRSIGGYKKILFPCIERVLKFADTVCNRLPGPIEFSKGTYLSNPTVRTLFVNHQKMAEVFSECQAVQDFFRDNPLADRAYMVLGTKMTEKKAFGMQQQGGVIIKDVMQTSVNFEDYRITHPSVDEATLRFNLHERALHECVAQTIKKMIATKNDSQKLEEDEVKLKMKLSMLKSQQKGLSPLMKDDGRQLQHVNEIENKIKKLEVRHKKVMQDVGTLNAFLKTTASVLKKPAELIDVKALSLSVDHFNHIVTGSEANEKNRIDLAQITFSENEKRVGILAIFPRAELITETNRQVFL